jgi:hypothetical protein
MPKTNYKHIFDAGEMRKFIKVRSICSKLACVSQARPVELSIEEVNILADYFPDLETMMQNSVS